MLSALFYRQTIKSIKESRLPMNILFFVLVVMFVLVRVRFFKDISLGLL